MMLSLSLSYDVVLLSSWFLRLFVYVHDVVQISSWFKLFEIWVHVGV